MPRRLAALALCTCLLALPACGDDDDQPAATTAASEQPAATTEQAAGGCTAVERPGPKDAEVAKPTGKLDPAKAWTATVRTNCGDFTITLDVKRAPKTAASFAHLAREGFFDGLSFHRIVPGFVIQGGDPRGDGTGGPGYSVEEAPPQDVRYTKGVVAMAKTAQEPAGTSGSQFYVVIGDDAGLPPEYALVGEVTKGLDVVERIGGLPLQSDDPQGAPPADPVVMSSVDVASR
ncbi:MAG: peptidylprolyl isomerase [Solirubrobacterales bacterium]|nr:peptidylprolyl isomerase [Solirubrobacterales bacterium]